jgi:hypothetical protein
MRTVYLETSVVSYLTYRRIATMYRDEVIEEVWRIRDEYVQQHHHSLDEIVEDLRRHQAEHPSRLIDRRRERRGESPQNEPSSHGAPDAS